MAQPGTRLGIFFGFFLAAAIAGAVGIHFAYDDGPPALIDRDAPFKPDPVGDPALESLAGEAPPSPFGEITQRDPKREGGNRRQVPGPKIIEVPPHLSGVATGWYAGAGGYETAKHKHSTDRTPLLLYFRVNGCPACRAFDEDVLHAKAAAACYRAAVKVTINPENSAGEKRLADQYGVHGFPTLLLIRRPGDEPVRLGSAVQRSAGGMKADPQRFAKGCARALGI